jgi:hypothetical protein
MLKTLWVQAKPKSEVAPQQWIADELLPILEQLTCAKRPYASGGACQTGWMPNPLFSKAVMQHKLRLTLNRCLLRKLSKESVE